MTHVARPTEAPQLAQPHDEDFGPVEYDETRPPESGETEAQPNVFQTQWVHLADAVQWLTEEPPRQTWLLTQWRNRRNQGVFPRGKTGLLNATGGVGKTYSLTQLALAVASGGFWFNVFRVVEAGHVCLALAEEDADEARRRLWRAANALELSADQRRDIVQRIHVLALHGESVALTASPAPGIVAPTERAGQLYAALEARAVDWALVVIDPLSRWAGGGVEADNEAATRFCQTVECFTRVRGNPSVLVAHHSSKTSAKDGVADARGVTGIRDGFRWQVTMDPITDEDGNRGIMLRNRKSNYSLEFEDVVLIRNQEPGTEGTLRAASDDETKRFLGKTATETLEELHARIVATVARVPGLTSANDVQKAVPGKRQLVLLAIKELRGLGRLRQTAAGFVVVPETEGGTK